MILLQIPDIREEFNSQEGGNHPLLKAVPKVRRHGTGGRRAKLNRKKKVTLGGFL